MTVSQAEPNASAAASAPEAARSRNWWTTLPGMLTAAAGLISAITGLIVAIQQIRPNHAPTAPAAATQSQPPAPDVATTTASGVATTPPSTRADTKQATPMRVTFASGRQVEIANLRYNVLGASVSPGNPGQLTLALRIRLTNTGIYDANFWNQTFRLKTAAGTTAPTNFLDDLVHGGTNATAEVDFGLPATTRAAQLLIGDDPQHTIPLPIALRPVRS